MIKQSINPQAGKRMLFIAITKWKDKCRFVLRLILFLLLLGLVIPKLLNYLAAEIAEYKIPPDERMPPALRVEKMVPQARKKKQPMDQLFLEKLRIFYHETQAEQKR